MRALLRVALLLSACVLGSVALRAAGADGASAASVNVMTPFADPTPPTVSLIAPDEGAVVRGSVILGATASDAESGVNKVEFLVDGTKVGEDVIEDGGGFEEREFSIDWSSATVGNGRHTIAARAVDNGTPPNTSTATRLVTVDNAFAFSSPTSFAAGDWPESLAVADLNGDGKADLVTANALSDDISVLLGNGDGLFRAAVGYPAGDAPSSIVTADVNGDGKPDLVTANEFSDDVSLLLGNGNGTFQTAVSHTAGDGSRAVAAADLNGDGRPDLATANTNSGGLSILLGNGDGTFQEAVGYAAESSPHAVVAADLNGDGKPDLVTANGNSSEDVFVLLGNGDGTFQAAVGYPAGGFLPHAVVATDLNGDGRPDLATANPHSDDASILLGNGDGTFQTAVLYAAEGSPLAIAAADVNVDARPDLATAGGSSGAVSVLLGNGDGTFQAAVRYVAGESGSGSIAAADLNGDGRPDLATANGGSDDVSVLLNTTASTGPAAPLPAPIAAADTAPPALTVVIKARQKLMPALRKGLRATAGCSEACAMQAKLLLAKKLAKRLKLPRLVGKATKTLAAAGTTNMVVKFTAKAKRKLAKLRSVRLMLELLAADAAGNAAKARKAVTLRR